jgi:hypothetical protein
MTPDTREGLTAIAVAIVFFVIPVSVGFAFKEADTPPLPAPPLSVDGRFPAEGALRFSDIDRFFTTGDGRTSASTGRLARSRILRCRGCGRPSWSASR